MAGHVAGRQMKPVSPNKPWLKKQSVGGVEVTASGSQGQEEDKELARTPKVLKTPEQPTERQIVEHEVTHLPFCSWCKHCVKGKTKNSQYKSKPSEEREVPVISMDYMFLSERKCGTIPALVLTDTHRGSLFA